MTIAKKMALVLTVGILALALGNPAQAKTASVTRSVGNGNTTVTTQRATNGTGAFVQRDIVTTTPAGNQVSHQRWSASNGQEGFSQRDGDVTTSNGNSASAEHQRTFVGGNVAYGQGDQTVSGGQTFNSQQDNFHNGSGQYVGSLRNPANGQ